MPLKDGRGYADGSRRSLRERNKKSGKRSKGDDQNFLENFDPGKSNREKRKLRRKPITQVPKVPPVYDEKGRFRHNKLDICDCMREHCTGCWMECENCFSKKCGVHCRVNRKFFYESITFDGRDTIIRNPHHIPK